jgi:hypothetical protein
MNEKAYSFAAQHALPAHTDNRPNARENSAQCTHLFDEIAQVAEAEVDTTSDCLTGVTSEEEPVRLLTGSEDQLENNLVEILHLIDCHRMDRWAVIT